MQRILLIQPHPIREKSAPHATSHTSIDIPAGKWIHKQTEKKMTHIIAKKKKKKVLYMEEISVHNLIWLIDVKFGHYLVVFCQWNITGSNILTLKRPYEPFCQRLIEHNIWQYILPCIYGMSKIPQLCLSSKIVSIFMYLIPTSKQNYVKSKPLIKLYCP